MTILLILLLLLNLVIGVRSYLLLRKSKHLFSDRYGMIIAMCSAMVLSIVIGIFLSLIININLVKVTIISSIICGVIGVFFGGLVKLHSVLSGFFNGVIGGMMGCMIGAVTLDPTICALPSETAQQILQNMILLSGFATFIVLTSFGLICYSLRV